MEDQENYFPSFFNKLCSRHALSLARSLSLSLFTSEKKNLSQAENNNALYEGIPTTDFPQILDGQKIACSLETDSIFKTEATDSSNKFFSHQYYLLTRPPQGP
jgi:hypothetical protein